MAAPPKDSTDRKAYIVTGPTSGTVASMFVKIWLLSKFLKALVINLTFDDVAVPKTRRSAPWSSKNF